MTMHVCCMWGRMGVSQCMLQACLHACLYVVYMHIVRVRVRTCAVCAPAVYVYVCVCVHVYVYMHMYICVGVWVRTHACVSMRAYMCM